MKFNLLTFNAHGLNDDVGVDSLHCYLMTFQPRIDIVAIQEYNLHGDAYHFISSKVSFFILLTLDVFNLRMVK
jgi:hypothetical protein